MTRTSRRSFVRGFAGLGVSTAGLMLAGACGWLPTAFQQDTRVARIGYLTANTVTGGAPQVDAFRQGMQERGYYEGRNVSVEYRYGEGNPERLGVPAAELLDLRLAVIVAGSTDVAKAILAIESPTPVVIVNTSDAVAEGLVPELAQPGGRVTGLSAFAGLNAKRLELLKSVAPSISRVAIFWGSILQYQSAEEAGRALGLQLLSLEIGGDVDAFPDAFERALEWGSDGFLTTGGPSFSSSTAQIVSFAAANRLPAMYYRREFAPAGGLMAYGPNIPDMFRRAASYVDRIVKGARPAELAVERPTTFDFSINVGTAQALGLAIPPDVAAQVTEWAP